MPAHVYKPPSYVLIYSSENSASSPVEDGSFEYMTSAKFEQAFDQDRSEFVVPEKYFLTSSCEQSGQEIENKIIKHHHHEATPSSGPAEYMSTAEVEEAFDQDKSEFVCAGKNYLWSAETYTRPDSPQPSYQGYPGQIMSLQLK